MALAYNLFFGTFIHLPRTANTNGSHILEINQGLLWVSTEDGKISGYDWGIRSEEDLRQFLVTKKWTNDTVTIIRAREDRNEFFFPGFIDTHIHAPQYPNCGLFGSSTLLDWLTTYTFPLEASHGDRKNPSAIPPRAITGYNQVVSRTLAHGTTCACYFATLHVPATNYLASLCHSRGQRAFVGRVCMDNAATCPEDYRDACPEDSVAGAKANIAHIQSVDPDGDLVKPIITPRFAPSCTAQALAELGTLAASHEPPLHIQTHISENKDEIAWVRDLFPDTAHYADVYEKAHLLTPRTILAHAIHFSPEERDLVASRESKVAHCPVSNSAIGSGLCPVRVLRESGITVGLGTDVSGGYNPGILESVRQAILVSRLLRHTVRPEDQSANAETVKEGRENLSVEEGLYLATRGGAEVVDMGSELGGFEEGMFWDAQMIQLGHVTPATNSMPSSDSSENRSSGLSNVDIFGWENWTEKVHKWAWNGDDRNVKMVWVRGRLVHVREGAIGAGKEGEKGGRSMFWVVLNVLLSGLAVSIYTGWLKVK